MYGRLDTVSPLVNVDTWHHDLSGLSLPQSCFFDLSCCLLRLKKHLVVRL
ncbi:MAG: hypothetical protein IJU40_04485 [Desulfovibrionaceae bacterium]|nr:hypothetical protein [Desulfovibrionaceae bacterium]